MKQLIKDSTSTSNKVVNLKPLRQKDIETLRKWRNKNRKYFVTQNIITPEMQKKWFNDIYSKNPNDKIYIVYFKDEPVGTLAMTKKGKDFEMGRVMLGEKKYKRKGIMGMATEKLLNIYKTKNKSQRVYLEVLKGNEPAISFYEKHGFSNVGENEQKEYIMERYV